MNDEHVAPARGDGADEIADERVVLDRIDALLAAMPAAALLSLAYQR